MSTADEFIVLDHVTQTWVLVRPAVQHSSMGTNSSRRCYGCVAKARNCPQINSPGSLQQLEARLRTPA